MNDEEPILNLAYWTERSIVNGPGERFVLWVQGCPLRCPGCINPDFLLVKPRHLVPVKAMAERILLVDDIEGITYSGGEPTNQAAALAILNRTLKQEGLTIVSYSGFTLEELQARNDPAINEFLAGLDILIDGPYIAEQAEPLPWRGSHNQTVHFLTDTYRHLSDNVHLPERRAELVVGDSNWLMTGIWEQEFRHLLEKALR